MNEDMFEKLSDLNQIIEPPAAVRARILKSIESEIEAAGSVDTPRSHHSSREPMERRHRAPSPMTALTTFVATLTLVGGLAYLFRFDSGALQQSPSDIRQGEVTITTETPPTNTRSSETTVQDRDTASPLAAMESKWAISLNSIHPSPLGDRGHPSEIAGEVIVALEPSGVIGINATTGTSEWNWKLANGLGVLAASPEQFVLRTQGRSVTSGSTQDGVEMWTVMLESGLEPVGALIGNGVVHLIADHTGEGDTNPPEVFTVDAVTGSKIWRAVLDGIDTVDTSVQFATFLTTDALLIVKCTNGIHALDLESGETKWAIPHGGSEFESQGPSLLEELDGVLYSADPDTGVIAIDADDGHIVWRADLGPGKAVALPSRIVHIGVSQAHGLNPSNGANEWALSANVANTFLMATGASDELAVYHDSRVLTAIDPQGNVVWTANAPQFVQHIAFLQGAVVVTSEESGLILDSQTGAPVARPVSGVVRPPLAVNDLIILHHGDRIAGYTTPDASEG